MRDQRVSSLQRARYRASHRSGDVRGTMSPTKFVANQT